MTGARVALLEPMNAEARARIEGLCQGLSLRFPRGDTPEAFAEIIGDVDYIVTRGLRFPAALLDQAPRLKLIHQWGTGTDGIPLDAARQRGVAVARSPGLNAPTVAEGTLALMLATLRRLPQVHATLRGGQWAMPNLWKEARDLGGSTVGLVGFGAIGAQVAQRLAGFDCQVIYTRRSGPVAGSPLTHVDLPELLAQSDVVSLHLPLSDATRHMIDAAAIATMKPGAILINTSRGGLVDEAALVAALNSGHLGGAGLDVFEAEPTAPDNPLLHHDSTVTMPHVAGRTIANFDRMIGHWAGNIRAHADGRDIDPACMVVG